MRKIPREKTSEPSMTLNEPGLMIKKHVTTNVPINSLDNDKYCARENLSSSPGLSSLAEAIDKTGLMGPPYVIATKSGYEVVIGHRRVAALKLLGRDTIDVIIIRSGGEVRNRLLGLQENLQREELRPVELAKSLAALKEATGATDRQLAKMVQLSRTRVTQLLGILKLPDEILEEAEAMEVTAKRSPMIEVAQAKTADEQKRVWELAKTGATVAKLRAAKKSKSDQEAGDPTSVTCQKVEKAFAAHIQSITGKTLEFKVGDDGRLL